MSVSVPSAPPVPVPVWRFCRCAGTPHRTTTALLRCRLGKQLDVMTSESPGAVHAVLHTFRGVHGDKVHARLHNTAAGAQRTLDALDELHLRSGHCSGTCAGSAWRVDLMLS